MWSDKQTSGFTPVKGYSQTHLVDRKLLYGPDSTPCSAFVLGQIIWFDYALRYLSQIEAALVKKRKKCLQRRDLDPALLKSCDDLLAETREEFADLEQGMLVTENMLPEGNVKGAYETLREDPSWWLRKELVRECIARGGCCARRCGCCENRSLDRSKGHGLGHCTSACHCCAKTGEWWVTTERRAEMIDILGDSLHSRDPEYLVKMADAFFEPQKKSALAKLSERLVRKVKTGIAEWREKRLERMHLKQIEKLHRVEIERVRLLEVKELLAYNACYFDEKDWECW
ncbi:hypothetical protein N7539_004559 [Penicillium diatomitis]|uniref:Uncharacterized protein n=1 Tax=Penicillium diatomitis TaxID=2819901 RepID=A0A9W9XE15_9EURO|nr:uncharacterized protein N7539_004559 [Penicillium diatomitis]KAJ5489669.1 hypothetical protein N7539_004559 [Penicillium diatomitis]